MNQYIFIDKGRKLGVRRRLDTVVVPAVNDVDWRSELIYIKDGFGILRETVKFGLRGEYDLKIET